MIAVDVGGTKIGCAIVDRRYRVVARTSRPTEGSVGASRVLANIKEAIRGVAAAFPWDAVAGLGVGSPGFVDPQKGIVRFAANIPGWKDVPLARVLQKEFGLPAVLGHDADLAALAEKERGAGRGKRHIVCLTVGTGIGMGIIVHGRIVRGAHGGAGNLGHMTMNPAGEILERLSAGPAIRERAIRAARESIDTSLRGMLASGEDAFDARTVCQSAHEGDEVSRNILREAAWHLGIGIANVINVLDPQIVIVGGGLAESGDLLFEPLRESVRAHTGLFEDLQIPIVPAALGSDAVLIGAACIAWNMRKGGH